MKLMIVFSFTKIIIVVRISLGFRLPHLNSLLAHNGEARVTKPYDKNIVGLKILSGDYLVTSCRNFCCKTGLLVLLHFEFKGFKRQCDISSHLCNGMNSFEENLLISITR